jgi:hypothetical protein
MTSEMLGKLFIINDQINRTGTEVLLDLQSGNPMKNNPQKQ